MEKFSHHIATQSAMPFLIKNGRIVTADSDYSADIFCEGETIAADRPQLDAPAGAEVIDATGKFVFPGFIDPHTHIYLPFMGTFSKDNYTRRQGSAGRRHDDDFRDGLPVRTIDTAEGYHLACAGGRKGRLRLRLSHGCHEIR